MRNRSFKLKLILGAAIVLFVVFKYCSNGDTNPYTNQKQHIGLSEAEEIAIGLQSVAAMTAQYGGLHPNAQFQAKVDEVGSRLVNTSTVKKSNYQYDFHLLADSKSINALALPGGQIVITYALFAQLENEDQLAAILGHEIGHVLGRHSAERLTKQGLTERILKAIAVDSETNTAQGAALIDSIINIKYEVKEELQSDVLGVRFMIDAGYAPEEMINVMKILKLTVEPNKSSQFQSTHPVPENKIDNIKAAIENHKKAS